MRELTPEEVAALGLEASPGITNAAPAPSPAPAQDPSASPRALSPEEVQSLGLEPSTRFEGTPTSSEEFGKYFDQTMADMAPPEQRQLLQGRPQPAATQPSVQGDRFGSELVANDWRRKASNIYHVALPGVLGGAGAVIGAPAAGAGAVVGGTLGTAGGIEAANLIDQALGIMPRSRVPQNFEQVRRQVGGDITEGLAAEATGQVLGAGVQKLAAPVAKRYAQHKAATDLLRQHGFEPTPGESTQSGALNLVERVLMGTPTSSGPMEEYASRELAKGMNMRDTILAKSGLPQGTTPEMAGVEIQDAIENFINKSQVKKYGRLNKVREAATNLLTSRDAKTTAEAGEFLRNVLKEGSRVDFDKAAQLYRAVGEAVPDNAAMPIPNVVQVADDLTNKIAQTSEGLKDKETLSVLRGLTRNPDGTPKVYTWDGVQQMRTRLSDLISGQDAAMGAMQGARFQSTSQGKILKDIKRALDADIEGYITQSNNPELLSRFNAAKAFYGPTKEKWTNSYITRLMKDKIDPEKIVDLAIQERGASNVMRLKAAIGNENFQPIKGAFTRNIMQRSETLAPGGERVFDPKALTRLIDYYGEDTLSAVYTKKELSQLKDAMRVGFNIKEMPVGNKYLASVVRVDPNKALDALIPSTSTRGTKAGSIKKINQVMSVLPKDAQDTVRQAFVSRTLALNEYGMLNPRDVFKRMSSLGDGVAESIIGKQAYKEINVLAQMGALQKSAADLAANPSGTAKNLIAYHQIGAFLQDAKTGAKYAITPRIMARVYMSPAGRKWLMEGYQFAPLGSRKAIEGFGRFMALGVMEEVKAMEQERRQ